MTPSPKAAAGLTTHVLDTARGRPAAGLRVDLAVVEPDGGTRLLKSVTTNDDGRSPEPLLAASEMRVGRYELRFHVAAYFGAGGGPAFYDVVPVRFAIADPEAHYHVPLLASPFGYVTYRGS